MAKKVAILGGGVAGLSAAHELIERGFQVEVFEMRTIPGGKARSIPVPAAQPRPEPWGDDGANAPGSFRWKLEPLPEPGATQPTNPNRDARAPPLEPADHAARR